MIYHVNPHVLTMIMVHACTMIIVYVRTMLIVHVCTMVIVYVSNPTGVMCDKTREGPRGEQRGCGAAGNLIKERGYGLWAGF